MEYDIDRELLKLMAEVIHWLTVMAAEYSQLHITTYKV
jgi:hypothetical protein